MHKPIRMLDLIALLRAARRVLTADDIAGRLGVSRRTVYRDIASLQLAGVPIDGAAGLGYILRPGFDLPPLNFTEDESEAIMLGLALLPRTGDQGLVSAAESVAAKIAGTRPGRPAAPLTASGWTAVPASGADPAALRRAIRGERALRLSYTGPQGETTDRTVLPIALIYYIEAVVLVGWCELRQAFRHFRLDRIGAIVLAGPSFRGRGGALRTAWQREQQVPGGLPG